MSPQWSEEEQQIVASKVRAAQIVYMVTCASVAIYLMVGYAIAVANDPFSGFLQQDNGDPIITVLRYILWAFSLGLTLPFVLLVRYLFWKPVLAAGALQSPERFGDFFLRCSIITSAISETPAIYGLVLFLMAGSWIDLIGLGALATVYKALFIPNLGKAMEWADMLAREVESAD